MKSFFSLALISFCLLLAGSAKAQQSDKMKRASPPATVTQTLNSGATVSIDYSQPSLKGRTIGKDVEPLKDSVWRMGANEATTFTTDKDVVIDGKNLPAGKYSLFGVWTDSGFDLIFNSVYKIWGTQHWENHDKDVLRVPADVKTDAPLQEKLTYTIDKDGLVKMMWGNMAVSFHVK